MGNDATPPCKPCALRGLSTELPYPMGTLYSYTTADQVAGLRNGDPLFSKVTTDSGHRGYVFDVLAELAEAGDDAAALLEGPRYEKGCRLGRSLAGTRPSPENYGDEIIAMTLKLEAIVARVTATSSMIDFIDAKGTWSILGGTAMPERIGAIHFFNDEATYSGTVGSGCYNGTRPGKWIYRGILSRQHRDGGGVESRNTGDQTASPTRLPISAGSPPASIARGARGRRQTITDAWRRFDDTRLSRVLASLAFTSPSGLTSHPSALADDLESLAFTPNPLFGRWIEPALIDAPAREGRGARSARQGTCVDTYAIPTMRHVRAGRECTETESVHSVKPSIRLRAQCVWPDAIRHAHRGQTAFCQTSPRCWEVHEDMSRLAWEAGRVLERRGAKRVYLAQLGSPADIPTSYAHAHVHVIPITATDESARPAVVLSWRSGVVTSRSGRRRSACCVARRVVPRIVDVDRHVFRRLVELTVRSRRPARTRRSDRHPTALKAYAARWMGPTSKPISAPGSALVCSEKERALDDDASREGTAKDGS